MRPSVIVTLLLVPGFLGAAAILIAQGAPARETRGAAASPIPDGPGAAPQDRELAAMREELARLRTEVSALRRAPDPGAPVAEPPSRAAELRGEVMRNPATRDAIARESSKGITARLDMELRSHDPAWSKNYESRLSSVLAQPELKAAVVTDLHCGSAVCRVKATHADLEAAEAFETVLTLLAPDSGGAWSQPTVNDDGSAASVVYLARKGTAGAFQAAVQQERRRAVDAVALGDEASASP